MFARRLPERGLRKFGQYDKWEPGFTYPAEGGRRKERGNEEDETESRSTL